MMSGKSQSVQRLVNTRDVLGGADAASPQQGGAAPLLAQTEFCPTTEPTKFTNDLHLPNGTGSCQKDSKKLGL